MNVSLYTDVVRLSSLSADIRAAGGPKAAAVSSAQTRGEADLAHTAAQVEISPEGRQSAQGADRSSEQQAPIQEEQEGGSVAGEASVQEAPQKAAAGNKQAQSVDAEEAETDKSEADEVSEKVGGSVGFNAAKRARQLAAAKTPEQVQSVLSLLNQDLSDCKTGLENGMCDENEVAKVEAMLERAKQRMSEVSRADSGESEEGADAFAIASLM